MCKDTSRVVGHYSPEWRLFAGLDPAGGNKGSGYTAFTLVGVDPATGKRYLVDSLAVKSMKAPQMKDQILEWTDRYPLFEWRVESNGVQSQIVQYDMELVQHLAKRGVRVVPHHTHGNKWDPQFGVESLAPLMETGLVSIPWGNAPTSQTFQPLLEELIAFPMGAVSDRDRTSGPAPGAHDSWAVGLSPADGWPGGPSWGRHGVRHRVWPAADEHRS